MSRLRHVHDVLRVTVILHPALIKFPDSSPATTSVRALQRDFSILERSAQTLRGGRATTLTRYRRPPVKKADILAPVQQYTLVMKVVWTLYRSGMKIRSSLVQRVTWKRVRASSTKLYFGRCFLTARPSSTNAVRICC